MVFDTFGDMCSVPLNRKSRPFKEPRFIISPIDLSIDRKLHSVTSTSFE